MIDFHFDEEQQLIHETVTSFAAEQVRPAAHDAEESGTIPESLVDQAWELGLIQGSIPEAYGGYAQEPSSAVSGAIVAEALAEGDLAIALHLLSPRLVVDPVLHLGSEEQRKELLAPYCGEKFSAGSAAVLEPSWDFSFTDLATTAKRDGGDYVLDGAKCFVPLASSAARMVVYAQDEEGVLGAFVVDAGTPGLEVGEREKNLGLNALETFEVTLSDCRVPAERRLGGDAVAMLRRSRIALSAMAVGVAKASLAYAIDYAKEREAFGVKIAQKQSIAFMLADMATETDAAQLLNWEAAWKTDQGEDAAREVALARYYVNDTVLKVADNGLQVLGGHGFVRDHPVELWLRNARGFAMFEGAASV